MKTWPIVERWDSHPLDLKDAQGRFRRSEWNYFLVDQKAGVWRYGSMGVWEYGGCKMTPILPHPHTIFFLRVLRALCG